MRTELGGDVSDGSAFANALDGLKRDGSNVLVVGEGATGTHPSACDRLLGDPEGDDRYRLFVVTEGTDYSCLEDSVAAGAATRIVDRSDDDGEYADASTSAVGTDLLSSLATETIESINEFESDADGLRPSQLRVCVDSLAPLFTDHDSENVFRLVHMTTSRIRQVDGMGHYHLPVGRDHDATRLLEPLFDAVVEVRHDDGAVQQRWHLRDQRTSSEWLQV